jgi:hypothetical protein
MPVKARDLNLGGPRTFGEEEEQERNRMIRDYKRQQEEELIRMLFSGPIEAWQEGKERKRAVEQRNLRGGGSSGGIKDIQNIMAQDNKLRTKIGDLQTKLAEIDKQLQIRPGDASLTTARKSLEDEIQRTRSELSLVSKQIQSMKSSRDIGGYIGVSEGATGKGSEIFGGGIDPSMAGAEVIVADTPPGYTEEALSGQADRSKQQEDERIDLVTNAIKSAMMGGDVGRVGSESDNRMAMNGDSLTMEELVSMFTPEQLVALKAMLKQYEG